MHVSLVRQTDSPMRSIRFQLVALLFITLLPAFAMLILLANLERQRADADTADESLAIARLFRGQFGALVESTREKLELMAHYDEVRYGEPAACAGKLEELFPFMAGYTGFYVADREGTVLCSSTISGTFALTDSASSTVQSAAHTEQFQRALETGQFVSGGLRTGSITGRPVFAFAMPILDATGTVTRVLGTGRDIGTLNRALIATDFPDNSSLILLDDQGRVALADPASPGLIGTTLPVFAAMRTEIAAEGATSGVILPKSGDSASLRYAWVASDGQVQTAADGNAVTADLGEQPTFYAVVGYTEERSTGSLWRALRTMLIGFGVVKIAALLVAFFAAEWLIVRRIKQLSQTARQMRAGDLSVRTGMQPNSGEIGDLAQALDSLAASLQKREEENVRLMNEVESMNRALEQRFNQRTEQLQQANRQLLTSQQELRQLSQQLMRMTEQERTRISREIHDQLGQSLTAIKMELRTALRKVESEPAEAENRIDAAMQLANDMVTLVRSIAANLRPGVLDDFGLAAAIDWHVADFCEKTGIVCDTDMDLDEALLNPNITTSAFRITQEALTNVARHAQATHVTITGRITDATFVIEIQDNGKGFALSESRPGSLGMLGMRERAAELGGTVTVTSEPDKGTLVRLVLPLEAIDAMAANGA